MVNSTNNTSADITMNDEKQAEVTKFKYLGATLCKDGNSTAEVQKELLWRPQRVPD
ncbi:hypothetical protein DPMN_097683 [Dreissena polymorpha]|uniref:Uncharacterized protein n=1 Tax=Dreissena polymorpha TaxID=45954 RepID=A0A9D4R5Y6_DREPO|nr:hypothetical protein DPMN_097683 [Dreissena polymorpha]